MSQIGFLHAACSLGNTSEEHTNTVPTPANKPTCARKTALFVCFYNLVSDFTLMRIRSPWSSFPSKLILVIFSSSIKSEGFTYYPHANSSQTHLFTLDHSLEFQTSVFNGLIEISTWMINSWCITAPAHHFQTISCCGLSLT